MSKKVPLKPRFKFTRCFQILPTPMSCNLALNITTFLAAVRGWARRQCCFSMKYPTRFKPTYKPSRLLSRPLLSLKRGPMIHAFQQQWPWGMSVLCTRFVIKPEKAHRRKNFISELFCDVNALSQNQDSACGASSTEYLLCWLRYSGTTSFIFFTMDMSS